MWVRIPAVTLVSLSKTLNHNCFSPPRGLNGYLWGQSWLISPICAVMAAIELYNSHRELRWFQEWFTSLMSRGNNAPWAPLSWWIRGLFKSTYYYYYYYYYYLLCIQADKESDGYDDDHTHEYIFHQRMESKSWWDRIINEGLLSRMNTGWSRNLDETYRIINWLKNKCWEQLSQTWWQNSMGLRIKTASICEHCMSEHWKQ